MRPVVHRVDAPFIARAVVVGMTDAVEDRIAQVHIRGGQVDFGPEGHGVVREFAIFHSPEPGSRR